MIEVMRERKVHKVCLKLISNDEVLTPMGNTIDKSLRQKICVAVLTSLKLWRPPQTPQGSRFFFFRAADVFKK